MARKTTAQLAFCICIALVASHSWVERLMIFNNCGTMVGKPGYTRGTVSRFDPHFNDFQMQNLLPAGSTGVITPQDRMCKSTQAIGNYSTTFPPLRPKPGSHIALQYQENGHVTLPELTPQKLNSGSVYIYGTSSPSDDDTLLSIHPVWDEAGGGSDGRGRLLARLPFDDGKCYQINSGDISRDRQRRYPKVAMDPQGADLWCQNDIKIPADVLGPRYSLYWVWDWPTAPNVGAPQGKDEIYTSCIDIEIASGLESEHIEFQDGQDLNLAGIKEQLQ